MTFTHYLLQRIAFYTVALCFGCVLRSLCVAHLVVRVPAASTRQKRGPLRQ